MVARGLFMLVTLAGLSPTIGAQVKVTPVQKVLEMLSEMKAKGVKMLDEEEQTMFRYTEWADDTMTDLKHDIEFAEREISKLVAFIEKADNKVARLGEAIDVERSEIEQLTQQKEDAEKVRKAQHEEYVTEEADLGESVDALDRAIVVMSKQNYARPQAEMMLQRMAKTTPGMRRVLSAFLQEQETQPTREPGAPEVAAYKFQSTGIVDLLKGLYKKFKAQYDECVEDEKNAQHYFELEVLHLSDTITKKESDIDEMTVEKKATEAASAKAKGELAETRRSKAADEADHREVKATFESKKATYEANQAVRKEEIAALSKAIEIISAPDVAGSYKEHVKLAQLSLLQVSSSNRKVVAVKAAAVHLQKQADRLKSAVLAQLAINMAGNPFDKVIGMIEDLIAKLKEEASAEAEHKAWCDEQLKENKLKRNEKNLAVKKLTAEVEALTADIETMAEQIDTLIKEQAALNKAMKEATEIRQAEKAKNTDTIADAAAGAAAVKSALEVLKEFYSSQDAFLQKQVPEMEEYKGMQNSKGGVIGMLEVIETDFARVEAETKASEAEAVRVYDEFMTESEVSLKLKHKEEVKLKLDKDDAEFKKEETIKDLNWEQEQLDEAKKYFEDLKPQCLEIHVSYEERVAKRKQEMEALKEAYAILDEKDGGESTYTQS